MDSHGNEFLDSIVGGKSSDPDVKHEGGGVAGNVGYRCDLLDPVAILNIAHIMDEGARKGRSNNNWRLLSPDVHINHALTHLMLHMAGSKTEDHIGRALTRMMMAVAVEKSKKADEKKPEVICLCGSTKFKREYMDVARSLALSGHIVLSVEFFMHADDCKVTDGEKVMLDKLHLAKIDMSDGIFVINVGGYVGESTKNEVEYAGEMGKKIWWLEYPGKDTLREVRELYKRW